MIINKVIVKNLKNYKEIVFEFNKKNDNIFFVPAVDNCDEVIGFYKSFEFLSILRDVLNFISPEYYLYGGNKFNVLLNNLSPGDILLFSVFYNYKKDDVILSFAISELGILYEKLEINKKSIIEYDGDKITISEEVNTEDREFIETRYNMAYTKTGFYKSNSILISSVLETKTLKEYLSLFYIPQLYYSNVNKYNCILSYLKIISKYSKKDTNETFKDIIHACEKFLSIYFPDHSDRGYKINENNLSQIYSSSFGNDINYFNIAGNGFYRLYWKILILIGVIRTDSSGIIIYDENFDEGLHPKLSSELLKVFNTIGKEKKIYAITNIYNNGIDNSDNINKLMIKYINYEKE